MVIAVDYPFLNSFWSVTIFFAWVVWIWMVISIFADIFSRRDISDSVKAAWSVFIVVVPFLGVLVYLIAHSTDMAERRAGEQKAAARADFDENVKTVAAPAPATGIEKATGLLDSGGGARLAVS